MLTEDFEAGLAELRVLTTTGAVTLMCAEAVPWRCHRSLVADALTARGALVEHITGPTRSSPHRLTAFAPNLARSSLHHRSDRAARTAIMQRSQSILMDPRCT